MITMPFATAPTPIYRTLMIFIDGGYLREGLKKLCGHDKINFANLSAWLRNSVSTRLGGHMQPDLIRIFYYDAIAEPKEPDYKLQKKYFDTIRESPRYEVKLGRLIRTGGGDFRQKGVDVLLAVDMLSKAHLNHYDVALLLAGDDDYVDLVRAVKDGSGKRVYGAFFPDNASKGLVESFDERIELTEEIVKQVALQ